METKFSIAHARAVFRDQPYDVTHATLRVDTPLGSVAIICGIAWGLQPDRLHNQTAIDKMMGLPPQAERNTCYRYVVSLPDPVAIGLAMATEEYFGKPKKVIHRGLQVDLLVDGQRKRTSKVAQRIRTRTNDGGMESLKQHLLSTATAAYSHLG